ncbi:MAG: hypothetical protein PHE09_10860 [Oscillospiraceae bacterium]|jgi:hypothetical protein|nr:hypothetical protein [Oscillospiraceae bacterium]
MMDEKTAWSYFAQSGSVQDYLQYAQCRAETKAQEERPDADKDRGDCHPGT